MAYVVISYAVVVGALVLYGLTLVRTRRELRRTLAEGSGRNGS